MHVSPLPKYRGSYPVIFQLLHKEEKIGVTIHKMDKTYDSGDMFIQDYVNVDYEKLLYLEVSIFRVVKRNMIKLIIAYLSGELILTPQLEEGVSYYSKNDLIKCLNHNTNLKDFIWMYEIFKIYKPFKVLIDNDVWIVDSYSHTPKEDYIEYILKDSIIYLKLTHIV